MRLTNNGEAQCQKVVYARANATPQQELRVRKACFLARVVSSTNSMNPTWYCLSNKLADPTDSPILITGASGQVPEHC